MPIAREEDPEFIITKNNLVMLLINVQNLKVSFQKNCLVSYSEVITKYFQPDEANREAQFILENYSMDKRNLCLNDVLIFKIFIDIQ